MKTLYLIGNGTRTPEQIQYCRDKTTVAFNDATKHFKDWGFLPTYYTDLELNEIYLNSYLDFLQQFRIFEPQHHPIIKILPNYLEKHLIFFKDGKRILPPNIRFFPYTFWDRGHSLQDNNSLMNLGCTGVNMTYAALKFLGFNRVILIGCDGYRESMPEPDIKNQIHHSKWRKSPEEYLAHMNNHLDRGWRRLKRWMDEYPCKGQVLNASIKTKITAFPTIKLGDEK